MTVRHMLSTRCVLAIFLLTFSGAIGQTSAQKYISAVHYVFDGTLPTVTNPDDKLDSDYKLTQGNADTQLFPDYDTPGVTRNALTLKLTSTGNVFEYNDEFVKTSGNKRSTLAMVFTMEKDVNGKKFTFKSNTASQLWVYTHTEADSPALTLPVALKATLVNDQLEFIANTDKENRVYVFAVYDDPSKVPHIQVQSFGVASSKVCSSISEWHCCNAETSGFLESNMVWTDQTSTKTSTATFTSDSLKFEGSEVVFSSFQKTPIRSSYGFVSRFQFRTGGGANGFAFVFQSSRATAGNGGGRFLGYSFEKSVAIEFDFVKDSCDSDVPHVEVHTRGAETNTPCYADNFLANQQKASVQTLESMNLQDGNYHDVTLIYNPFKIIVYIDGKRVVYQPMNSATEVARLGEQIYFGFTGSSNADAAKSLVEITKWRLWNVPESGPRSELVLGSNWATPIVSEDKPATTSLQIDSRDACGNSIGTGSANIMTTFKGPQGSVLPNNAASTQVGGIYNIFYWSEVIGKHELVVLFNDQAIDAGDDTKKFDIEMQPEAIDFRKSDWAVPTGSFNAGENVVVTINAKDMFGNNALQATDQFKVNWNDEGQITAVQSSTDKHIYTATISTTRSGDRSIFVRYNNNIVLNAQPSLTSFTVVPAALEPVKTEFTLESGSFSSISPGVQQTMKICPKDGFGNKLISDPGKLTFKAWDSASSTETGTKGDDKIDVTTVGGKGITWKNGDNCWEVKFTLTKSQNYQSEILYKDSTSIVLQFGIVVTQGTTESVLITPETSTQGVGAQSILTLNTLDQYGNSRITLADKDVYIKFMSGSNSIETQCTEAGQEVALPNLVTKIACTYSSSGKYGIRFTPYAAESFEVHARVASAPYSKKASFTVVNGQASSETSILLNVTKSVEAGKEGIIVVQLKDANGNIVPNHNVQELPLAFTATSTGVTFKETTVLDKDQGKYQAKFSANYAEIISIQALLQGTTTPLQGGPLEVQVTPAASDASKFSISGDYSYLNAALTFVEKLEKTSSDAPLISIETKDRFGNEQDPLVDDTDKFQVVTTPTADYDITRNGNEYNIKFATLDAGQDCVVKINFDGVEVLAQTFKTTADAGKTWADTENVKTLSKKADSTLLDITVFDKQEDGSSRTKDSYGNVAVSFSGEFVHEDGETVRTSSSTTYKSGTNEHKLSFSRQFEKAGKWYLGILLNGKLSEKCKPTSVETCLTLTVTAGAVSQLTSTLSVIGSNIQVSTDLRASVLLLDAFRNKVGESGTVKLKSFESADEFSTTYNDATKQYDCTTLNIKKSGSVQIQALNNGNVVAVATVTAKPGDPSDNSLIAIKNPTALSGGIAGEIASEENGYQGYYLDLRDAEMNAIETVTVGKLSLRVMPCASGCSEYLPTDTVFEEGVVNDGVSQRKVYVIKFTPLKVGSPQEGTTLTVYYDNVEIASRRAFISHGFISEEKSIVTAYDGGDLNNAVFTADDKLSWRLNPRDAYENEVRCGSTVPNCFHLDVESKPASARNLQTKAALFSKESFLFEHPPSDDIRTAGDYVLRMTYRFADSTGTTKEKILDSTKLKFLDKFSVLPGATDPLRTLIDIDAETAQVDSTRTAIAGSPVKLKITLRDQYNNPTSSSSDSVIAELTEKTPAMCNPLDKSKINPKAEMSSITIGKEGSTYTGETAVERVGTYAIFVYVNSNRVFSKTQTCDQVLQYFSVEPAPIDYNNCLIKGEAAYEGGVAGKQFELAVIPRDSYNNTIFDDKLVVTLATSVPDEFKSCNADVFTNGETFKYTSEGGRPRYVMLGLFEKASTSVLAIKIANNLINKSGGCRYLRVYSSYPQTFEVNFEDPAANHKIGTPVRMVITAKDRFKNAVDFDGENTVDGDKTYTLLGNIPDAKLPVLNYAVVSTSSPKSGQELSIMFVPEYKGTYKVVLSRPQLPAVHLACFDNSLKAGEECVYDVSMDIEVAEVVCPEENKPYLCGDGNCVASSADCAGAGQVYQILGKDYFCPGDFTVCTSDVKTCIPKGMSCPQPPTCAQITCPDGKCVDTEAECFTPISCPNGQAVCPDGSCRVGAECPIPFECFEPINFRCPDGSCRKSIEDCPSLTACPENLIRCDSGQCAHKLGDCKPIPNKCSQFDRFTCADGSCAKSVSLCPTRPTCFDGQILCADGGCAVSPGECSSPITSSDCPKERPSLCPDGSCIRDDGKCPTNPACPVSAPVLCSDGSCAATLGACSTNVVDCPHVRCPDGACRDSFADCPTKLTCPPELPVRCAVGGCAASVHSCGLAFGASCPPNEFRCPGGECAIDFFHCPSHTTCPKEMMRCYDGTCREDCSQVQVRACATGLFSCPQGRYGSTCVASLDMCPTSPTCPRDKPVKCADSSCTHSVSECPKVDIAENIAQVPCADGGWDTSSEVCGDGVTCPPTMPVKCWDKSCRMVPEDCPAARQPDRTGNTVRAQRKCPEDAPILCSNGSCERSLVACQTSRRKCTGETKVKCPFSFGGNVCVRDVSECEVVLVEALKSGSFPRGYDTCPDRGARCMDGSCRYSASQSCPGLECPLHLPFLCQDGTCASEEEECPLENGCPFDSSSKCPDGSCVKLGDKCPDTPTCPEDMLLCIDGSCRKECVVCNPDPSERAAGCVQESGCKDTDVRCSDGTCAQNYFECTGFDPDLGGVFRDINACPATAPYKCENGFCSISSRRCPVIHSLTEDGDNICPKDKQYMCADGKCGVTSASCRIVRPCSSVEERCDDGTCALIGACSNRKTCPMSSPYRCKNGLCAHSADFCIENPLENCPGENKMCLNKESLGMCPVKSTNSSIVHNPSCDDYILPTPELVPRKTSDPVDGKCAQGMIECANGKCAPLPAHPIPSDTFNASCPIDLVCPVSKPHMCADGDCVATPKHCRPVICPYSSPFFNPITQQCQAGSSFSVYRCPYTRPILCPSGACSHSLASCGTRPKVCEAPKVQCFDGSCEDGYTACQIKAQSTCTGATVCYDGSCAVSSDLCPVLLACTENFPLRCPDGSCQKSSCSSDLKSGNFGVYAGCPFNAPYHCYGSLRTCVANAADCAKQKEQKSEGCTANCEKFVPASSQYVHLYAEHATTVPVSISSQTSVRTTLSVPAGAVPASSGITNTKMAHTMTLQITPVSLYSLRTDPNNILSSPFKCNGADGGTMRFLADVTVEAAIDRTQFLTSAQSARDNNEMPCELQNFWSRVFYTAHEGNQICYGTANVTKKKVDIVLDPQCINIKPQNLSLSLEEFDIITEKTDTSSSYKMIFTDRASEKSRCVQVIRDFGEYDLVTLVMKKDPMDSTCPSMAAFGTAAFDDDKSIITYALRRPVAADVCLTQNNVRSINSQDVCLGVDVGSGFRCPESYENRVGIDWNSTDANRLRGRLSSCDPGRVYAFINSPLPAPPQPLRIELDWWTMYGDVVLGLIFGFTLFFLVTGYALWRLYRYRYKYKDEKKHLDELIDRAAEIDEFAGGLGIADTDGDLDMVANPLVVEMQELERREKKVQSDLKLQEGADAEVIDTLEVQRQKIHAEIMRVKTEIQRAQSAMGPTRVENTVPAAPRAASRPVGAPPRQSSSPTDVGASAAAPPSASRAASRQQRQAKGFAAPKARKKKDI